MSRLYFSNPGSGERWFRVGTVDVTTTILITALASLSIFVYAADPALLSYAALYSPLVSGGQLWRLVTWPLVNPPAVMAVVQIVIFWYFGSNLERVLGRIRFLWMVGIVTLIPALGGTLFAVLTGQPLAVLGIGFLADAIIVAFVAANPMARSFFDIPFWILCAVFLGLDVLQYTGVRAWGNLLFLLLVIAISLLAARSFGISLLTWIPRISLPAVVGGDHSGRQTRKRARAAKLSVVRSNDIDSLLDKIAEHGIGSLTADERRRLDDHGGARRPPSSGWN